MKAYMILFVLSLDSATVTDEEYQLNANDILEVYPTWPDTELFVAEVRKSVLADIDASEQTSWNSTLKLSGETVRQSTPTRRQPWKVHR